MEGFDNIIYGLTVFSHQMIPLVLFFRAEGSSRLVNSIRNAEMGKEEGREEI